MQDKPILLIGGYGVTGEKVSRALRRRHPDVPLVIGGRSHKKAAALAENLGNASPAEVDLGSPTLGLVKHDYGAIGLLAHDPTLNAMNLAARTGAGYLVITGGAFEFSVDAIPGIMAGKSAPIVYAGYWYAGAVTMLAAHLAGAFQAIDSIEIGLVIDRGDGPSSSGPATTADFKRISANAPSALQRLDGSYVWKPNEQAGGVFRRSDGLEMDGVGSVSCDVVSIGAATRARNIRVLEGWGVSASRAHGGPPCDEINVRISGVAADGKALSTSHAAICARTTKSFTVISTVLLLERLTGLDRAPPPTPGFYLGEHILAPRDFVERMLEEGVTLHST